MSAWIDLKRLMEHVGLRTSGSEFLREDWLRVGAWMQEAAEELDDLETLGTDQRPTLREVR